MFLSWFAILSPIASIASKPNSNKGMRRVDCARNIRVTSNHGNSLGADQGMNRRSWSSARLAL